jgi:hypothetical protein
MNHNPMNIYYKSSSDRNVWYDKNDRRFFGTFENMEYIEETITDFEELVSKYPYGIVQKWNMGNNDPNFITLSKKWFNTIKKYLGGRITIRVRIK